MNRFPFIYSVSIGYIYKSYCCNRVANIRYENIIDYKRFIINEYTTRKLLSLLRSPYNDF